MEFPFSTVSISLSAGTIAGIIFCATALFVGVVSGILFFHWRRYGLSKPVIAMTEVLYLVVCVLLLSTAFFALP